jgi:hypothetical protein
MDGFQVCENIDNIENLNHKIQALYEKIIKMNAQMMKLLTSIEPFNPLEIFKDPDIVKMVDHMKVEA